MAALQIAFFRRVRKIAKTTISIVMSVSPSVFLFAWNNSAFNDEFSWNLKLEEFKKYVKKIQIWLKSHKNNGNLHEDL